MSLPPLQPGLVNCHCPSIQRTQSRVTTFCGLSSGGPFDCLRVVRGQQHEFFVPEEQRKHFTRIGSNSNGNLICQTSLGHPVTISSFLIISMINPPVLLKGRTDNPGRVHQRSPFIESMKSKTRSEKRLSICDSLIIRPLLLRLLVGLGWRTRIPEIPHAKLTGISQNSYPIIIRHFPIHRI